MKPSKKSMEPLQDNDYIRNLVFRHASMFPEKCVSFSQRHYLETTRNLLPELIIEFLFFFTVLSVPDCRRTRYRPLGSVVVL